MIEEFEIQDYGCVRHVKGRLSPLHAFIGPNDSGKSTLLRAIGTAAQLSSSQPFRVEHNKFVEPFDPRLPSAFQIEIQQGELRYAVKSGPQPDMLLEKDLREVASDDRWSPRSPESLHSRTSMPRMDRGVALVRLDPDAIRRPSGGLRALSSLGTVLSHRGHGIPGLLHALILRAHNDGTNEFEALSQRVAELWPHIERVGAEVAEGDLVLAAKMTDGTRILASDMSEGLLLMIAYLVIEAVGGPRLLLVEEPENGLHPHRIKDVVRVLRNIAERGTQVLIATHSPLVINELAPEEVTLVTRPDLTQGTILTPMTETENFADRSVAFELGELWLFHADGESEVGLTGKEPEAAQ